MNMHKGNNSSQLIYAYRRKQVLREFEVPFRLISFNNAP